MRTQFHLKQMHTRPWAVSRVVSDTRAVVFIAQPQPFACCCARLSYNYYYSSSTTTTTPRSGAPEGKEVEGGGFTDQKQQQQQQQQHGDYDTRGEERSQLGQDDWMEQEQGNAYQASKSRRGKIGLDGKEK
eukprot:TRINITY_DN1919_c4_g1_i1.p2 TRINITY_DN1919_c4_g1~~TRINITY_DN1919_c4_g1_i1.p2  ORF type:complete len:131 (+),score=37.98 TRINITY_DN1919_c4_g1_i1:42-434(+)